MKGPFVKGHSEGLDSLGGHREKPAQHQDSREWN
jgi:hypothetical protein